MLIKQHVCYEKLNYQHLPCYQQKTPFLWIIHSLFNWLATTVYSQGLSAIFYSIILACRDASSVVKKSI